MRHDGTLITSKGREQRMWASCLYEAVDGKALSRAADVVPQSLWISDGTSLLTGRNFIKCVKARINALPAKSRTTCGRPNVEKICRAGCSAVETPNHCLQHCFRTHAARVKRHNNIVSYVQRSLEQRGFEATLEPIYKLSSGVLKPDLVAKKGERAFILDAQIVGDGIDVQEAHKTKVLKYSRQDLLASVRTLTGASQVFVTSVTLN